MRLGVLVSGAAGAPSETPLLLARAAKAAGHEVLLLLKESLALAGGVLTARETRGEGESFAAGEARELRGLDLLWNLAWGRRAWFLDATQLLWLAGRPELGGLRVVNDPLAVLSLGNKYAPALFADRMRIPETYAANDPETLAAALRGAPERDWIVKPVAESMGRGVRKLTGREAAAAARELTAGGERYGLVQAYLPEAEAGELRVLVAGGTVLAGYRRVRTARSGATGNLARGGQARAAELSQELRGALTPVAERLLTLGVVFAGLDVVALSGGGVALLEVNVACPGGLGTLQRLTGKDFSGEVLRLVLAAL